MTENALAVVDHGKPLNATVVHDDVPVMDTAKFDHMFRIARVMAATSLVPESLRTAKGGADLPSEKIAANCFLVINQASRWGLDPFAVMQGCSVVHGRLMFEGKLVAAVLKAMANVRLTYVYFGEEYKPGRGVIVQGTFQGENEPRTVKGTVEGWRTTGTNNPWSKPTDYDRQLAYRGAREWARIHAPEAIQGIYSEDEFSQPEPQQYIAHEATAETKPKALTLDAGFPTKEKEKAKPKAEQKAPPASPPPPPPAAAEKVEPEAKGELVEAGPALPALSLEKFLSVVDKPTTNVPEAINEACFVDGALVVSDEVLAQVWIAACKHIAQSLDEGELQALAMVASAKNLDAHDDLAGELDNKRWVKALHPNNKANLRRTLSALRKFKIAESTKAEADA